MLALVFAAMMALALTEDDASFFGLPGAVLGPISFAALVVAWVIFQARNWRCPACDEHLGRAFNPKHCRSCGLDLRG